MYFELYAAIIIDGKVTKEYPSLAVSRDYSFIKDLRDTSNKDQFDSIVELCWSPCPVHFYIIRFINHNKVK